MDWTLNTLIFGCACGAGGFILACLCGLRGKISDIVLSRSGLRIHTNSGMVVYEMMGKIDQIDTTTKIAMRKATESLTVLPAEKYGTSMDVMLINLKANSPLLYASYENHITRELRANGADRYIEEKTNEVLMEIRFWAQQYPELPQLTENLVCLWTKRALIPNIRRACHDKLEYYRKLHDRTDIIESLRDEAKGWIEKNEKYLECIDKLSKRSDVIKPEQEKPLGTE